MEATAWHRAHLYEYLHSLGALVARVVDVVQVELLQRVRSAHLLAQRTQPTHPYVVGADLEASQRAHVSHKRGYGERALGRHHHIVHKEQFKGGTRAQCVANHDNASIPLHLKARPCEVAASALQVGIMRTSGLEPKLTCRSLSFRRKLSLRAIVCCRPRPNRLSLTSFAVRSTPPMMA